MKNLIKKINEWAKENTLAVIVICAVLYCSAPTVKSCIKAIGYPAVRIEWKRWDGDTPSPTPSPPLPPPIPAAPLPEGLIKSTKEYLDGGYDKDAVFQLLHDSYGISREQFNSMFFQFNTRTLRDLTP